MPSSTIHSPAVIDNGDFIEGGGYLTPQNINRLERTLTPLLHKINACCACTNWPMHACICIYLEFGQAASNRF